MLNEVATLCSSLRAFGVEVQELHPWVKRLKRSAGLIIGIDSAGKVGSVEYLEKDRATELSKIQQSNHSNFPALNWDSPIWQAQPEDIKALKGCKDVRKRLALLTDLCNKASLSLTQPNLLTAVRGLAQHYRSRFSTVNPDEEFRAFHVLLDRMAKGDTAALMFFRSLTDSALALAGTSSDILKVVETLLVGDADADDDESTSKVPIFLDLADCTRFDCRVADTRMASYFSACLNATEPESREEGICALTGKRMPLETDKMPSPRLPVLGDTILMSMNPDTPCQRRYGRIGTEIFPLGKTTASDLNSALRHLTSSERTGMNWQRIPAHLRGKSNLLLVYLRSAPLLTSPLATLFSESEDELYSATCEDVRRSLEGRATFGSDFLALFILNKISKGQVQIELSLSFTAEQAIQGGNQWQIAARNLPRCVASQEALAPYPSQVARSLQSIWIRNGSQFVGAPGVNIRDIYAVLVAGMPGAEGSARTLLSLTVTRTGSLLRAVGHNAHRGERHNRELAASGSVHTYRTALAVLAITLFKLGYRKDVYMAQPAFRLGRLLSLVDTLHREYCNEVRGGDIPPQLLGNALMATVASNPKRGLSRMRERIRVYQAWAATRGSGLARWSLAEMGKITPALAEALPERMTDADQAQFLLGYLARSEKTEKEATPEGAIQ